MFEIGDKVRFREWSDKPWQDEVWEIIDIDVTHQFYGEKYLLFTIYNDENCEVKTEVNWQQIEII